MAPLAHYLNMSDAELERLQKIERLAREQLQRMRSATQDADTLRAAQEIWEETVAALSAYQQPRP